MKVMLLTAGSQGDVQPFLALSRGLRERGHVPQLVAPPIFHRLAAAHSIPFVPLADYDMDHVATEMLDVHGPRRVVRMATAMGRLGRGCLPRLWEIAAGSDVVVHHPLMPLGQHVAEGCGLPAVAASPAPFFAPTGQFPSPLWATTSLPSVLNRPSYAAIRRLLGASLQRDADRWRAEAGLPRRRHRHNPLRDPGGHPSMVLHGYSPAVVPPPADWPPATHTTGYWFLPAPASWTPSARLTRFLRAGPPPVGIGFGSVAMGDPAALVEAIRQVADRLDVRVLVLRGYRGLRGLTSDERIHLISDAPHEWLFPQLSAVVHHGGAGTTGAAAAAGLPQVICPAGTDQPFWAARLRALGAAAPSPPLRALTAGTLASALRQALADPRIRERAADLSQRICAEDGPARAVTLIEQTAASGRHTGQRRLA